MVAEERVMNTTEPSRTPGPDRPRGAKRWPAFIFALIGLQLALGAITVYFATNDPSFAIEPDAYEKALNWDERAEARRASEALGWTCDLRVGQSDGLGDRYLFLTVTDRDGRPLESATVRGLAFHQARAAERFALEFRPVSPGLYRAKAALRRDGRWSVQLTVERDEDVFLTDFAPYLGPRRPSGQVNP
jgi:nitrogen fixation protein FixH